MLQVDCSELTTDEQLALASEISNRLEGRALALVKGKAIVLDQLSQESIELEMLRPIVEDFVSRRAGAEHYSTEVKGETVTVRSRDPVAAMRRQREGTLPPNLKQCPMCPFVTQYEEEYTVHVRSHYFGV